MLRSISGTYFLYVFLHSDRSPNWTDEMSKRKLDGINHRKIFPYLVNYYKLIISAYLLFCYLLWNSFHFFLFPLVGSLSNWTCVYRFYDRSIFSSSMRHDQWELFMVFFIHILVCKSNFYLSTQFQWSFFTDPFKKQIKYKNETSYLIIKLMSC